MFQSQNVSLLYHQFTILLAADDPEAHFCSMAVYCGHVCISTCTDYATCIQRLVK